MILGICLFLELKYQTHLLDFNLENGCDMLKIYNSGKYYADHGLFTSPTDFSSRSIYPDIISFLLKLDPGYEIICIFHIVLLGIMGMMIFSVTLNLFHIKAISFISISILILFGPVWMYAMVILRDFFSVFCSALIIVSFYGLMKRFSFLNAFFFSLSNVLSILNRINFAPILLVSFIFFLILFFRQKMSVRKRVLITTTFVLAVVIIATPFFIRGRYYQQTVFKVLKKIENPKQFLTRAWSETVNFDGDTFLYDNPKERKEILLKGTMKDILVGHIPDITNWFGAYEIPDNVDYYQFRSFSWILRFMRLDFALLTAFFLVGLVELIRVKKINLFVIFMVSCFILLSLSFILTIPSSRYRLATIPFLIPISGYAVYSCYGFILQRKYSALLLIALFIAGYYWLLGDIGKIDDRLNNSWFAFRYGELLMKKGLTEEAKREFHKAVFSSYKPTAPAFTKLAYLYFKDNRFEEARSLIFSLKRMVPEEVDGNYILAVTYYQEKKYQESLFWFRKYIEKCPADIKPQIETIIRQLETDPTKKNSK